MLLFPMWTATAAARVPLRPHSMRGLLLRFFTASAYTGKPGVVRGARSLPKSSKPMRGPSRGKGPVPSAKNWSREQRPQPASRNQPSPESKVPEKSQQMRRQREVSLPSVISVHNLARVLGVNMRAYTYVQH